MNVYRSWLWLRSLAFWVWQIALTLLLGLPVLIGGLFSFRVGYGLATLWNRGNLYGLRAICGVRWQVDGIENIPDKPCIVMSKHQSTWDTYFLPMMFYPSVFVAKRSLLWIPIFGWCLYVLRFIMIDRASGRLAIAQMCEQAQDRLARKRWVVVFPEGTRRPVGAEPNYRIGGAAVASKLGCDIVPVALNAGEFWPRMGFIKWPGTITVSIGPVIHGAGQSSQAILHQSERWIEGRMAEITVKNRFPY